MNESSQLMVDLDKIRQNTAMIVEKCHEKGIAVLGVTKGFSAIAPIVMAMIQGGVDGLADSRIKNIVELRKMELVQPITLLRIPGLSNVGSVVRYSDISVNSEVKVIRALDKAARLLNKQHEVILMVDVGDLREGVLYEHVVGTVRQIAGLKNIKLLGLGTNMGCYGGVLPSNENLGSLVEITGLVEKTLGVEMEIISGGGTSTLMLLERNEIPTGINQLRIGEGILLGTDTTNQRKVSWLHNDAFRLTAEVIEVKDKPSMPFGDIGLDAFGNKPEFEDIGIRKRAILALGKQDVYVEGIAPVDQSLKILGASSDHLILDITEAHQAIRVGDGIDFHVNYAGLLSVCQSRYVKKVYRGG